MASADLLVLDNGESLTGQTSRIDDGILVFRTSLAGQMMVPVDTIKSLSTDANLILTLQDKQVFYGRLTEKEAKPYLQPIDGGGQRPIDLAQIAEAMPIPSPPQSALDSPGAMAEWKSSLESGFVQHSGNKTYGDAFARAQVSHAGPRADLRANLFLERADTDEFPRVFRGQAELRRMGESDFQPFASFQAERDTNAALNLRTGLTLGLNAKLLDTGDQSLEALAGLNAAYEEWDAANSEAAIAGMDLSKTGTELNVHLGLRFARALWGNGIFTGDVTLLPALSELGDLRARSEAAIMFPVYKRLQLRLNLLVDYDSHPEFRDLNRWDASFGAGLHVDF